MPTKKKRPKKSLREFMDYFQHYLEAGGKITAPEPEERAHAVQMMTVHAAKGLEFPVVFVLSVSPRRFPATERRPIIQFPDELRKGPLLRPKDIHLQEERRLFFVALTRGPGPPLCFQRGCTGEESVKIGAWHVCAEPGG